jgi:hypothetical protein
MKKLIHTIAAWIADTTDPAIPLPGYHACEIQEMLRAHADDLVCERLAPLIAQFGNEAFKKGFGMGRRYARRNCQRGECVHADRAEDWRVIAHRFHRRLITLHPEARFDVAGDKHPDERALNSLESGRDE